MTPDRALEIAALVRAGVRLQQPDALELALAAERLHALREAVLAASLHHGSGCGRWSGWTCSCGLDAVVQAAR